MSYYSIGSYFKDVGITIVASLGMGLMLALAADLVMVKKASAASERELIEQASEENVGIPVLWARGYTNGCEEGLMGFYDTRRKRVVMCEAGLDDYAEMIDTLRHEVWHAVQYNCNGGQTVLSDEQIRNGLKRSDVRVMRKHYKQHKHRLEGEARTVAQMPTPNFLQGLERYCAF